MTLIVTSDTFDVENLIIQPPVDRAKGKYISYLSYGQKTTPLFIRTPLMKIEKMDNSVVSFKIDKTLEALLRSLDHYCIEEVSRNSVTYFKGKNFSRTKIENSFINSHQDETVYTFVSNELKIRNQKGSDCTLEELYPNQDAIAIFHVKGIVYKKSSIQLLITLEQLKVYVNDHLDKWCLETVCETDQSGSGYYYEEPEYDSDTETDISELSGTEEREEREQTEGTVVEEPREEPREQLEEPVVEEPREQLEELVVEESREQLEEHVVEEPREQLEEPREQFEEPREQLKEPIVEEPREEIKEPTLEPELQLEEPKQEPIEVPTIVVSHLEEPRVEQEPRELDLPVEVKIINDTQLQETREVSQDVLKVEIPSSPVVEKKKRRYKRKKDTKINSLDDDDKDLF